MPATKSIFEFSVFGTFMLNRILEKLNTFYCGETILVPKRARNYANIAVVFSPKCNGIFYNCHRNGAKRNVA